MYRLIVVLLLIVSSPSCASSIIIMPPDPAATTRPVVAPPKLKQSPVKAGDVFGGIYNSSVIVTCNGFQGSGVLVSRNGVSYVWTAGHVLELSRKTRTRIGADGIPRTTVFFDDAVIKQIVIQNGEQVGKLVSGAEVVRYSSEFADDIALLRVKGDHFVNTNASFLLDPEPVQMGTDVLLCSSPQEHTRMSNGIINQTGVELSGDIYDAITCASYIGSSGGGIYKRDGSVIGLLVQIGKHNDNSPKENEGYMMPMRRILKFAKRTGVMFALDPSVKVPSEKELWSIPIEEGTQSHKSD